MRTWRVKSSFPDADGAIPLVCACGTEATVPTKGAAPIIAVVGMRLILDPPGTRPADDFLPEKIQCRRCGRIYEAMDVR
jgi:hypothetical protein